MALTPPTPTALKDLNLASVKTWDDFTVKVIPCLNVLVDGKILAQFTKGPSAAVLKHFTAVRSELAPLVTSLW